ncbi:Na+/H+-dicarboxylate symporter [Porphyromonadaceae bacterium NLAE-zl-C104]|uniref:dicarboxylate/amino acid:cation symporter n=1 Tax=Proteiniphilum saccharofermentans TaxID=1642647 RepID=UPI00089452DD|nr:dicarboxylate/amino acid:cation symporter [Proteiniphilum saccharofermentans]SDZ97651.1 Na+/H+-dicarboxylate symporter [Porphyromonadaceae bacterium KH3R12]SFT04896.1 Na+/H+-dicarboxylate symporter [Porphyromonadaceae bacterium NLAE-zl-C104]
MKKLPLHWKIVIGMVFGILFGVLVSNFSWGKQFVSDWIAPFGTIFIRLLKLIAIPLIFTSLVKGISDLKDISRFRNIGVRTIILYINTTATAIIIGLLLVNTLKPGAGISQETIDELTETYAGNASISSNIQAAEQQDSGPLDFLVNLVPENIFTAFGDNSLMLQVIFFSIIFGISMLLIDPERARPVAKLITGLNEIVLKMVNLIMLMAPFAVFALLAQIVVSSDNVEILQKLLFYGATVLLGLILMLCFYLIVVYLYTGKSPGWFIKGIAPAQLLAFSTSSSAATLPVTMERVTDHLGVDNEVSSFVLPVGATINMDGTSLYQSVAAVFIAQALHFPLDFSDQLTIILTALLASIGAAAVPGTGMIMLVIVLESIGFPADKLAIGLALIFAIDRPLDMCRTVINITGDSMVSVVVAKSLGKLHYPVRKEEIPLREKDDISLY